jgi:hypothetical protein
MPTYLHQVYLPATLPPVTRRFVDQPISQQAIDWWLYTNRSDANSNSVYLPGYLGIGDVPADQVLCKVIMCSGKVSGRS